MEVIILQHQDRSFSSQGQAPHPSSCFLGLGSMRASPISNPTFMSPKISLSYVLMGLCFSVPGCHPTTGSQEQARLSAQWKLRHAEVCTSHWGTLGWERQARACSSLCPASGCLYHVPEPALSVPTAQAAALGSPCSSGKGNVFPFPSRSARQQ